MYVILLEGIMRNIYQGSGSCGLIRHKNGFPARNCSQFRLNGLSFITACNGICFYVAKNGK